MDSFEKVREIWKEEAESFPDNSSLIQVPSEFRVFTLNELRDAELLTELMKTYQHIFGDADAWNEGAFCDIEGRKKTISLKEYNERQNQGNVRCECGGLFYPCHPAERLEKRFSEELADPNSILILMQGNDEFKVAGFLWGTVSKFAKIEKRILKARYPDDIEQGAIELKELRVRLDEKGLLNSDFLYGDEMGVLRQFRGGGIKPVLYLTRLFGEHGQNWNTNKAIFWTSKKSPLYQIMITYGFEPLYIDSNGLEFLLHPDFDSLAKVMKNLNEENFRRTLVMVRRQGLKPD